MARKRGILAARSAWMRIGLFLKYLDEEYQSSVYAGVREAARRLGIQLVCVQGETFEHCRDPGATLFPALAFLRLDGILLLSSIIVDQANPPPPRPRDSRAAGSSR
jgi:DNA-binding LacI/PurR family transcriptional regulator